MLLASGIQASHLRLPLRQAAPFREFTDGAAQLACL